MRILGFTKAWDKLEYRTFTTFRFARKDKDWQVDEIVRIVLNPRSPNRQVLGTAFIVAKEQRWVRNIAFSEGIPLVTHQEAMQDGFSSRDEMVKWMSSSKGAGYRLRIFSEPMNKLTLQWMERYRE